MILRIIYTSRATRYYNHTEIRDLCLCSAKRNRTAGITGLILYDGVRFLQALEGARPVLEATMTRIMADDRHHDIVFSCDKTVLQREFPEWSMETPFSLGDDTEAFLEKVKADVALVSDVALKAQFIGFAKLASTGRNRL